MKQKLSTKGQTLISVLILSLIGAFAYFRDTPPSAAPGMTNGAVVEVFSYGEPADFSGHGFIVSHRHVLTSDHSIGDPSNTFIIRMPDGTDYSAELLARNPLIDAAILKITAETAGLPQVPLGDSEKLAVGQEVYTPEGPTTLISLSQSLTAAKWGATRSFEKLLVFRGPVLAGTSGSPLLDGEGLAVGMILVRSPEGDVGFALPINRLKDFLKESIEID